VAVKIFRSNYAQRQTFREYFLLEAEKIGQFNHPNILPILEYGEGDGLLYTVSPFVMTGTLDDLLRRVGGRFSAIQALPIIQQLCQALQYAHDRNVIHGNIKPANVFVASEGRMLLADFGIAHGYDDSQQSLTRVGWGSAEYAAPEQSLGIIRRSSDIYALGVLLFRILTGVPPFTGQTPVEVLLKHVRQPAPSARSFVANISDAVDGVLQMALQKRGDDRFVSAQEFSDALLAAVTVAPVASPVAKSVSPIAPQFAPGQSSPNIYAQQPAPISQPLTPIWHAHPIVNDPQTPLPVSLALFPTNSDSVPAPSEPSGPFDAAAEAPSTRELSWHEFPAIDPTDSTQIQKKNFLQENDDHKGTSLFWSVDPAEWSPIAMPPTSNAPVEQIDQQAIPYTANEYLSGMSVSEPPIMATPPDAPIATAPSSVAPLASSMPRESQAIILGHEQAEAHMDENATPDEEKTLAKHLRRWLPIIVVILLLLGLVGAILSSFFFPESPSGAYILPSHPLQAFFVNVVG
jgi:serine/threonine protein kinase